MFYLNIFPRSHACRSCDCLVIHLMKGDTWKNRDFAWDCVLFYKPSIYTEPIWLEMMLFCVSGWRAGTPKTLSSSSGICNLVLRSKYKSGSPEETVKLTELALPWSSGQMLSEPEIYCQTTFYWCCFGKMQISHQSTKHHLILMPGVSVFSTNALRHKHVGEHG